MKDPNINELELPIEKGITNNEVTVNETDDIGHILRVLRLNQGFSIIKVSKMIGLAPQKISAIERSQAEIPSESLLRQWLKKLGCKDNLKQILALAREHQVKHWVSLKSKDPSNSDLVRLIYLYRDGKLSPLDRSLLTIIGRE